MKKITVFWVIFTMMISATVLAESNVGLAPGNLGFLAGGGEGGQESDEVNDFQFLYIGSYYTAMLNETVGIRGTMMYFGNFEEQEEYYSSSASGLSSAVETYRPMIGLTLQGEQNGWWSWNHLAVGADHQEDQGWLPVTILHEELMFGSGWFYNFLCATARVGDEDYQSYYLRDQAYFKVDNWLHIGPQVQYIWFYQTDDEGDRELVYEPAWGGQIKFTENSPEPKYSLTVGATNGNFVGMTYHVDVWIAL
jgi:hypothetical protein